MHIIHPDGFLGPVSLQLSAGNSPRCTQNLALRETKFKKFFENPIFVVESMLSSFSISVTNAIWKWSDGDNENCMSIFLFYLYENWPEIHVLYSLVIMKGLILPVDHYYECQFGTA